ncbi:protein HGH1 homolog isoform X2 [Chiloscyllium plagiosum]|nr:protein HGH1 homolog isoform X2 [Chiloscyllium plagiosum]XP_043546880.1 protein HGH1 homolog isoform X2 [Chiloscyllium plagiosum]XP_043546881.1 protein HGH1 homolog isoform X2 [Chiloscyllium plagiosum]XP_043546882.1 protein HGH1 homolog isoform X2 [Chiloscyllium plagiosum]
MLNEEQMQELLGFLTLDTRLDVKGQATECVLGLTGSNDGRSLLGQSMDILRALLMLTKDPSRAVAKDCYFALVNLSADETIHQTLIQDVRLVSTLLPNLLDPGYDFSDQICSILSNLTREKRTCADVFHAIQNEGPGLAKIVDIFCTDSYNENMELHYLGPLLSNLTQLPEARQFILDKDRCVVQRLLPYTQYEASSVRRGGVVGTLRNCCFDYSHHQWLLSNEVDILPYLLLPLAGPEELSEDEMEGLPVDLQYLPEDKQREKDPDIRKMLLEAINLLMATRSGREVVREKKTYLILREYHKWETEPDVAAACEKLIEVLISDEPEPGMENLLEVEIPEEIEGKLKLQHEEEQQRIAKEKEELLKSSEGGREHGHRGRGDSPEGLER